MAYHRTFIAINLPEKAKKSIIEASQNWQGLPAKWTSQENLHLTLMFFGDTSEDEISVIGEKIKKIAADMEPFRLQFNEFIYGPKDLTLAEKPRMIWLRGPENEALEKLQSKLEEAFGILKGRKKFRPHITIARLKNSHNSLPQVSDAKIDITVEVESIELMESNLTPAGPEYTILLSAKFGV